MQRKLTLILWMIVAVTFGVSLQLRSASAHADYDRAEPAADAVLSAAPAQVRIWFTQELFRRQGMNQIEVVDAAGQRVDQDDVTIDDDDRKLMQVTLAPNLPQGVYTVLWQSLSAEDGHEGKGEFTFTVGEGAPAGEEAAPQAEVSPTTTTPEPAATASPTSAPPPPIEPTPTATTLTTTPTTTPTQVLGLPCLGGAMPLLLVLGVVLTRRRVYPPSASS